MKKRDYFIVGGHLKLAHLLDFLSAAAEAAGRAFLRAAQRHILVADKRIKELDHDAVAHLSN